MEAGLKKAKSEKLGLVMISRNETCYDIPVYVAVNGHVKIYSSTKRVLKMKQEEADINRKNELGEGWVIYKAYIRVDLERGSIVYDDIVLGH